MITGQSGDTTRKEDNDADKMVSEVQGTEGKGE
jgi:hypothetical protein